MTSRQKAWMSSNNGYSDRYPNTESMLPPSEAQTANLLSCYVGETMIRRSGGHWALESDANDVFFGLPIVVLV